MSAPSSSGVCPGMPWIRSRPRLATPARRRRRKAAPGSASAARPSTARRTREKLCAPSETRMPRAAPAPPATGAGCRPRRVGVVDVLGVGLDGDLRVRRQVRPEELEQPLEPRRPQQARSAAAKVERVQATHVVRRPLPLPLGGDAVDERVEPAGGLRPRPPVRRVAHRRRGEVAVVAPRPAERHVHVDVPHRAGEGGLSGGGASAAHVVGTQKYSVPSRSSSSTPPFFSITRREAALPASQSRRAGSTPRAAASGSAAASMAVA